MKRSCESIDDATAERETAIANAFELLQGRKPDLPQILIEMFGDCRRAARWMCLHQRALDGRRAYELLVEGNDDLVWDEMERSVNREFAT